MSRIALMPMSMCSTAHRLGIASLMIVIAAWGSAGHAFLQPAQRTSAAADRRTEARHWFQDAKLGLFVHWGAYALLGKGEWAMENDKLPIREYAKLPPKFNPTRFDATAWVKLAKSAGAKYITITAKHHDGFCMFASGLTDYDIVDATPYHADPLKALADACHQEQIKLFFYYSLLDWHHPDYFPLGKTGASAGRDAKGNWKKYVAFYQSQVRELCTNYGAIAGIWFDGWWDKPDAEWDLEGTYRLIHELQPGALVANNHHVAPIEGEDFQIFEQDLPGSNTAGFNKAKALDWLPLETCMTINRSWGYNSRDAAYKSAEQIIHALLGAAGRGANLLLNVGPHPDGTIGPEMTQRLQEVGKWLADNGQSVYGTRRGPIPPQPWGVSTATGSPEHPNKIYLHVFEQKEKTSIVFDPSFSWSPYLFAKHTPLTLKQTKGSLVLDLPAEIRLPIDTIITLSPKTTAANGK
jgi:alpha-L-fucosidase